MGNALPPERLPAALRTIADWRSNPDGDAKCPVCAELGLTIIDQSARPHAEWYALSCKACGLEHAVNIPMPGPSAGFP